jgi:uncharacterized membrane protein
MGQEPQNEPQDVINEREWASPWNWSASGFYSSEADNRLWVPKRPMTGSGHAINLGHPGARTFIIGMLIVPAVIIVLVVLLMLYQ